MKQYNSYKDSGVKWIGEMPYSWVTKKLKYLAETVSEIGLNGVKIGLENIESKTGNFVHTDSEYDGIGQIVHKDDIVYGKLRPYLCKAWKAEFECNAVGDFYVFRCNHLCDSSFIQKVLVSNQFNAVCTAATYGTKMPRVSLDFINSIFIPIPSLPEQQAIADFLDGKCAEIDGLLADLDAEVKTLAEYKKSIFAETVTRGLNPNVPMKQSGIPWAETIPEHWKIDKGKYYFELRRTKGNPHNLELMSPTQKFGVIPQSQLEGVVLVKEKTDLNSFRTIRPGDFCISLRSFQGGFEYSRYEGVVSPAYQVFYPIKPIVDGYFKYMFKSDGFISYINTFSMSLRDGKNIPFEDFGNSYIPIPPDEEQEAIATYLDEKCAAIDQAISDKQTQIETLKSYRASLIYEYVTGKKQVI